MAATSEPFRPPAPTNGKAFTVDVNALVIALITVLLTAILGFAAMGFFHLNTKIDGLGHDLRQEMNARFDKQDARLDKRFDKQDARLDERFDSLHQEIADLRTLVVERLPVPSQR